MILDTASWYLPAVPASSRRAITGLGAVLGKMAHWRSLVYIKQHPGAGRLTLIALAALDIGGRAGLRAFTRLVVLGAVYD